VTILPTVFGGEKGTNVVRQISSLLQKFPSLKVPPQAARVTALRSAQS